MAPPRTIMASKFKEQCLALLDLVESTKVAIIVTKHGRPVAQLTPLPDTPASSPTMGSVQLLADDDDSYFATGETWQVESDPYP